MKEPSNKVFVGILSVCFVVIVVCSIFIMSEKSKLTEKTITDAVERHIGSVVGVTTLPDAGGPGYMYRCDIWSHDYRGVMDGLRKAFIELKEKENTGYGKLIFCLNDAERPEGQELVNVFLLLVDDLYGVDWEADMTYDQFKELCNIDI